MNRWLSLLLLIVLTLASVAPVTAQDTNYVVQPGDTLLKIAVKFNTSIAAIKLANGLFSDLIFAGQTLKIPSSSSGVAANTSVSKCPQSYIVTSGDSLRIIAERCGVSLATLIATNRLLNPDLIFVGQTIIIPTGTTTTTTSSGTCGSSYTVQRGEALGVIAEKCNVTLANIITLNGIINPNLLYVGQVLIMPGQTIIAAPQTTATPAPALVIAPTATAPLSPLVITGINNATATPKPSSSSTGAAPVNASRGMVGELTLCNPEKPTFATTIERICFRMKITNTTNAPINYSILGVQATNLNGGANQFQTSWRGNLSVAPNGVGPTSSGWEDGIFIQVPGTYALQIAICYAVTDTCLAGTGWEILTPGKNVTAIYWTP